MFEFLENERNELKVLFRKVAESHFNHIQNSSKTNEKNVRTWLNEEAKNIIKKTQN